MATITGGSGNETLVGDLFGVPENDWIDGGLGADTLIGKLGSDTYIVDNVNDKVVEQFNQGTDSVRASVSFTLPDNVEILRLMGATGTENLNGTGNALNNNLIGNSGSNILKGNAGNDVLNGLLGNDRMEGGLGDDAFVVDSVGDVVVELAGQGRDLILTNINLGALPNNVEDLTLTGGAILNGTGNSLSNTIKGNNTGNILNGMAGNDTLYGLSGDDYLVGGLGNDTLLGHDGTDYLNGYGTTITSDAQIDYLNGGAGGDQFILGGTWGVSYVEPGDGYAVIQDWNWAAGDRIQVHGDLLTQYKLVAESVTGIGTNATDMSIYYTGGGGMERIAVVQDSTDVFLAFSDFIVV
jgi:trimeric autotransporter adhesin